MDKVAIVKCSNYSVTNVKNAIMKSFELFGGTDRFFESGEKVLLKPNLIATSKDDGATTDARFVEAIIEIVKEQHAIPLVGDSPAFGSARGVAKSVGIMEVLERQKVDIIEVRRNIRVEKGIRISKSIHDFDKIINLPKLKAHGQIGFTGATKNLFGFTKGKIKAWQHVMVRNDIEKFCLMILKIYDFVKPAFTLVDAIEIMEKEGPRGGPMRHFGFIFSGINCLSIDTVILKCLGIDIHKAPLLQVADKHGYKGTSLDHIVIKGESISSSKIDDFAYPDTLSDISFNLKGIIRSVFLHLWLLMVKERR